MRLYRTLSSFAWLHTSYFSKFAFVIVFGIGISALATMSFFYLLHAQLGPRELLVVPVGMAVLAILLVLAAVRRLLYPIQYAAQSMEGYRKKKEALSFPSLEGDEMATLLEDVRAVVQSADNATLQRQGVIEMLSANMNAEVSALNLIGDDIRPKHADVADRLTEAGARMASLVDIFLETMRKEEELARKVVRVRRVEFAEVGQRVRRAVEPMLTAKQLELSMSLPERSFYLKVDDDLLFDVLVDLVGNAAKFSDVGGKIEFVVARRHGLMSIMVRDYGKGIYDVGSIFKRLRAKTGDGQSPTGLYLCRQIVNRFEGTLIAQSDGEGKGSTFIMELPLFRLSKKKR